MSQPAVPPIKMPGMSRFQMQTPLIETTLNPAIFEQLIKSQGIRILHAKPVPCPFVTDISQSYHSPSCAECLNGFVYFGPREFVGVIMSNTLERRFGINGTWDVDSLQLLVPVFDSGGQRLDVSYFDQLILLDTPLVRYYQRVEHSQSGIDRLHFPAVSIEFILDNSGQRYLPGVDVEIKDGRLHWIGKRPQWDSVLDKGSIFSVSYYVRPSLTVLHLPHQLRMAQTQSEPGSNNITERYPQLAICRKDFLPFDSADVVGEPDVAEPGSGSFR